MEEIIELVDENDRIIGSITKTEAHKDKTKIHREVGVILINKKGEILLQQRSLKKSTYPGLWVTTAGGHVEMNETPYSTASRELEEEVGVKVPIYFLTKKFDREEKETHFIYWYLGEVEDDIEINIDPSEVEQAKFFSREEFDKQFDINNFDGDKENTIGIRNGYSWMTYKISQRIWDGEFKEIVEAQRNIDEKTDEPVYLVDENDTVLGKVSRNICHSHPEWIHREVGVIIINEMKEILWEQRDIRKRINPGMWTLTSAGHVKFGQTYEEAAHQELLEEVGFDTNLIQICKRFKPRDAKEARFFCDFLGLYNNEKLKMEKGQVSELKFLSVAEIERMKKNGESINEASENYAREVMNGKYDEIIQKLKEMQNAN